MASAEIIKAQIKKLRTGISRESLLKQLTPFKAWPDRFGLFNNYSEEIELLKLLGIHPASPQKVIYDPFNDMDVENNFTNIGHHCLAVAACTHILAGLLEQKGAITNEERNAAIRRALLHDAIKPYEVFLGRAISSGRINENEYYKPEIFEPVKECLLKLGISHDLTEFLVDDIGTETNARECFYGLWELSVENEITLVQGNWPWKLVQFADNMTYSPSSSGLLPSDSYFLTSWERIAAAENQIRYPWAEVSGLGIKGKSLVFVADISKPDSGTKPFLCFHDCYIWNSHLIASDISIFLEREAIQEPETYLKNLVNNNISMIKSKIGSDAAGH